MNAINIQQRVLEMESFQRQFKMVLRNSAINAMPNIESESDNDSIQIDWNNLLSLSSILAKGEDFKSIDTALRIAQSCLIEQKNNEPQRLASAVILEELTNKPSIRLAISRNLLSEDFRSQLPLPLRFDILLSEFKNSIFSKNNEIVFINSFQTDVYKKSIEVDVVSISAPTSAGKSFILSTIILDIVAHSDIVNIIYLVPTRALISQVESDLREMTNKESVDVYISSVPQKPEEEYASKSKILIFTQERLHWFRSNTPIFNIDYLIIDEAQKIEDGHRGIMLQQKVEEVIRDFPKVKIFFSSPFSSNPEIFTSLLPQYKTRELVLTEFVAVNQNLFYVTKVHRDPLKIKIELVVGDNIISLGFSRLPFRPDSDTKKIAFTALTLGDNEGGNIIYASYPSQAEQIAWLISDHLKDELSDSDSEIIELVKLIKNAIHEKYTLREVLKHKVAFHYGNMPPIVREEIERLFKKGKIKFLVCTSTLLEGVNMPAKSIFVHNPRLGKTLPMRQSDFWNLAGRAGRWGKEFQGNVFCIEPSKWKTNINFESKKQIIARSIDKFLAGSKQDSLIEYINDSTPRHIAKDNEDLEYAFGYFYSKFLKDELNSTDEKVIPFFNDMKLLFEGISSNTELPDEIVLKNSSISVFAQQELLNYFKMHNENILELIPLMPEDSSAVEDSYKKIIMLINFYLSGDSTDDKFCFYQAILVVSWIRGYPLSFIIDKRMRNMQTKGKDFKDNSIIRETMSDIEEFARYKFAKFYSCYIEILKFYLMSNNLEEHVKKIPDLGIWLELGVSMKTQISLVSLGLNRNTAIEISRHISSDSLSREEAKMWVERNYEIIDISPIMKFEIERILFSK